MTRRRGFTLIEVLTVIAIIVILVGIIMFTLSKVMGSSKTASTGSTMGVLKSMLAEFEVATKGLNRQPPYMWDTAGGTGRWPPPPDAIDIWRDGDVADDPVNEPDPAKADQGEMSRDSGSRRYEMAMVGNTQLVMGLLLQAPGNKKVIEQLSAGQMMEELPAGLAGPVKITIPAANGAGYVDYTGAATNRRPSPPIVVDGWGNPIIFVPAGGLYDVVAGDVRRNALKDPPPGTNPGPIRSPDGRPFWASAGPDGVFSYVDVNDNKSFDAGTDIPGGDDNIYSFAQH